MSGELSPREAILVLLSEGPAGTGDIAASLDMPERSARRRLRRLIHDGYVFSHERARHRITASGLRAIEPLEDGQVQASIWDRLHRGRK